MRAETLINWSVRLSDYIFSDYIFIHYRLSLPATQRQLSYSALLSSSLMISRARTISVSLIVLIVMILSAGCQAAAPLSVSSPRQDAFSQGTQSQASLGLISTHQVESKQPLLFHQWPMTNLAALPPLNAAQQRSYELLLQKYHSCFWVRVTPSSHPTVVNAIDLDIYESHSTGCDGDPHTSPRIANYLIDHYGRLFQQNILDDSLELQYRHDEQPTFITDVAKFTHPSKAVFAKYGLNLYKIEKRADNTFVIFYVYSSPLLTSQATQTIRQQLFKEVLAANGEWDYILRATEDGDYFEDYYVEGRHRKLALQD